MGMMGMLTHFIRIMQEGEDFGIIRPSAKGADISSE
jgi:hypothetical protein